MPNDERALVLASTSRDDEQQQDPDQEENIRDIHALTPPRTRTWENSSHRSSNLSEGENFSSMSREFNALVNAGSTIANYNASENDVSGNNNLGRIGEEEMMMMMMDGNNPLAIVPDNNPLDDPVRGGGGGGGGNFGNVGNDLLLSVQRVKKEEVESKINAWQNAKVAKINNRFKREDAIISGWESEQVQKATSSMKKVERKLEEKRARALEKMQNDVAKAHRKAEERRASAEAKRGTKVAKILEICNLMRAVGRPPVKRSFF